MKKLIITFTEKENNFNGYINLQIIHNKNFNNFLNIIDHQSDIREHLKHFKTITYLKHIYIEEQFQNLGHGKQLITNITKTHNNIILIADTFKQQRKNFNLEIFYKLNNFKTISYYLDFPIMFYKNENHDIMNNTTL